MGEFIDDPNLSTEELLAYNAQDIEDSAKRDLDFLAGLAIPDVSSSAYPNFYVGLWNYIIAAALDESRNVYQLALGLPRGHAKTTWLKLLILFLILFTSRKFILVLGSNAARAEAILADIATMLDSQNIQTVFGNWRGNLKTDRQNEKIFTFRGRTIILAAAGQGTAVRGANRNFERPDAILLDDAQTASCAKSEIEAESFASWFWGDIYKAKDPQRCLFIYIGNMYPDLELNKDANHHTDNKIYACMLRNLQLMPTWTSFITGGIQADGTALWEEVQPLEQLLMEFQQDYNSGRAHVFLAEVQNDPNPKISAHVDTSKFASHNPEEYSSDYHQGSYINLDPATSRKSRDEFTITYTEIHDGVPLVQKIIAEKLSSPQAVWKTLQLCLDKQCSTIIVEANFFQYSLVEWFDFVMGQMKLTGINIIPHQSYGAKNTRILELFKELTTGGISISTKELNKVVSQSLDFDPNVTDNVDDILDGCHMSWISSRKYKSQLSLRLGNNLHVRTNLSTELSPPSQY